MKIVYPKYLLKLTYHKRFIYANLVNLFGLLLLVIGIFQKSLILVYVSAFFIGVGVCFLFLIFMSFLAHFPDNYMSTYLIGDFCGGLFITFLYLSMHSLGVHFGYVGSFVTQDHPSLHPGLRVRVCPGSPGPETPQPNYEHRRLHQKRIP